MGFGDIYFSTEDEATQFLQEKLEPYFLCRTQVRLTGIGIDNPSFKIDLLVHCRDGKGWTVGFEIKRGFRFMSEYAEALKQAADYRNSTVSDPDKASNLVGTRLAATFVFPVWDGTHDNGKVEYAKEASGMAILAQKFRVGTCGVSDGFHGVSLVFGQQRLWSAGAGWIADAEKILFGKRQIGSRRLTERRRRTPDHPN